MKSKILFLLILLQYSSFSTFKKYSDTIFIVGLSSLINAINGSDYQELNQKNLNISPYNKENEYTSYYDKKPEITHKESLKFSHKAVFILSLFLNKTQCGFFKSLFLSTASFQLGKTLISD